MASASLPLSLLLLLLLLLLLPFLVSAKGGFSVELIHRDSPKSPLHDTSKTVYERLLEDARRSIDRAEHLHRVFSLAASGRTYQSPVFPSGPSYLMEVDIGTPARKIYAIADTGSDLTWANCKPCNDCYPQVAPLFDPKNSSTYRDLSCDTRSCTDLHQDRCTTPTCHYTYYYADGSRSSGNLASETFTFAVAGGSSVKIPEVSFGCSHQSQGTFDNATAGIVGLSGGSLSLVTQLGSVIDKKFSYCLVPRTEDKVSSRINFGANAVVSGRNVVSAPMLSDGFYVLSLQSLAVHNHSIPVNYPGQYVVVDSGTTLTFLHSDLVQSLADKLKQIIKLPTVQDPEHLFDLCFDVGNSPKARFPDITFKYEGAAPLTLTSLNTFLPYNENTVCLAILPSGGLGVLGNIAQQNFHIGFDLVKGKLSFAPADCTKY